MPFYLNFRLKKSNRFRRDFVELVSLSKFDTTSRYDFVVVSLPSRRVAFFSGIYIRGTNNGFISLSLWQFFLAVVLSR